MNLYFSARFKKKRDTLPPALRAKLRERLLLFSKQPFDRMLTNHALQGKYNGYRSIDIAGDYRAVYEPLGKSGAYFITHGTHTELYG